MYVRMDECTYYVRQAKSLKADMEACKRSMIEERQEFETSLKAKDTEWAGRLNSEQAAWTSQENGCQALLRSELEEAQRALEREKKLRQEEETVWVKKVEEKDRAQVAHSAVWKGKFDRLQEELRALKLMAEKLGCEIGE